MTEATFRRIALDLPETEEREHMDHPDFRVRGKIFATLHSPEKGWGMVKLTPAEQKRLMKDEPGVFDAALTGPNHPSSVPNRPSACPDHFQKSKRSTWRIIFPSRNAIFKFAATCATPGPLAISTSRCRAASAVSLYSDPLSK